MSQPLLCVLSYAKANEMVIRHWPFLRRSRCDILGVGRIDTNCMFPTEGLVGIIRVGKDSYVNGDNLIQLQLQTLARCLDLFPQYTGFVLAEPDTIFFQPMPPLQPGFTAHMAGYKSDTFKGARFYHPPWCMDRETASRIVKHGPAMISAGRIENGFPDRWYGLVCDELNLQVNPLFTYSRNNMDQPHFLLEARSAIKAGAICVHGLKTKQQLADINLP